MTSIEKYFYGEKSQCSVGIALAIISIGLALYFMLQIKTDFYKGIAYPFLIISGLLFIICTGVVLRTSKDIKRVSSFQLEQIKTEEIPRMEKVMSNFKLIKIIEICIIIAGFCLLLFPTSSPFLKGIGLGLIVQSLMMYWFDHLAESRGKIYMEFLQTL